MPSEQKEEPKKTTAEPAKGKERAWGNNDNHKTYTLWDFTKFTLPFLWRGGLAIKLQTILTFTMMIFAKVIVVTYPIFLKYSVDGITCDPLYSETVCPSSSEIYFFVGMYGGLKFSGDLVNYLREIPFASVTASAECYIANMVYKHT